MDFPQNILRLNVSYATIDLKASKYQQVISSNSENLVRFAPARLA